jgi:molybdenum cofactor cytidylyltransferase
MPAPFATLGVVVLAAGTSSRLGQAKQLLEMNGEPALRHVARLALATGAAQVVVVITEAADDIERTLDGLPLTIVRITNADEGMSASLRAGVAALDARCMGALILLTDQTTLRLSHIGELCETWQRAPSLAVASRYDGILGVPAVLPRSWFEAVESIRGDVGARELLRARQDLVTPIDSPGLERDLDTPADLEAFRTRHE